MVRKRRLYRNRSLGVGTFTVTLLFAGMHQKFVLEPMVVSVQEAKQAADFVTGHLQSQFKPVPERKTREASVGIDALLQEKLEALLLADSQAPAPLPPLPITHTYYPASVPR